MLVHPQFDPIALQLGPLAVRWYGLMYLAGFLAFLYLGKRRAFTQTWHGITPNDVDDLLFYGVLGVVLGGRLGQVIFYEPAYYLAHPLDVLAVWKGGMSFHGGFIGVMLAAIWFTRQLHVDEAQFAAFAKKRAIAEVPADKRSDYISFKDIGWLKKAEAEELRQKTRTEKIDLMRLGDVVSAAAPIGLFFGRIANFINGELWGRPTDAPWGVVFCN